LRFLVLFLFWFWFSEENLLVSDSNKKLMKKVSKIHTFILILYGKADDKNLQEFTLNELANFDGSANNLIYLGCKNYVFDVTNSGIFIMGLLFNSLFFRTLQKRWILFIFRRERLLCRSGKDVF